VPLDARIPATRYSAAAPQQPKAECPITGLLHLQQIYSKSTRHSCNSVWVIDIPK
jgi:hypothetical protein